jgi:hypothetical protein
MPMAMRNSNRRKLLHNHMQSNSSSNANEYVMIEQELGVHRCITTALTAMQERKRAQEREQERLAAEKASQVVDRRGIELAALTQKLEPLALKIKHVCTVLYCTVIVAEPQPINWNTHVYRRLYLDPSRW